MALTRAGRTPQRRRICLSSTFISELFVISYFLALHVRDQFFETSQRDVLDLLAERLGRTPWFYVVDNVLCPYLVRPARPDIGQHSRDQEHYFIAGTQQSCLKWFFLYISTLSKCNVPN
jgi:hypothetical protein